LGLCAAVVDLALAKGHVPPFRRAGDQPRAAGAPPAPAAGLRAGAVAPRSGTLNVYQKQRIEDFLAGTTAPLDTLRILALQVQFADSVMGGQSGSLRSTVHDSTWFANELRHLEEYYRGASRGGTEIAWVLDGRLYDAPEGMRYYGDDDTEDLRVVELAQAIIDLADDDVDFSRYHTVFFIHAGAGQETDVAGDSPEQIWSSFYDLGDIRAAADSTVPGLVTGDSLDGEPYYVTDFSIVPESASQDFQTIGTLGIWAFETGSRLGLLPMFDSTPSGFNDSQGVGNFCVMAYGLWVGPLGYDGFVPGFPCAFNRMIAGWINPPTVDALPTARRLTLGDINSGSVGDTLCVRIPVTENEYFLVVNRVHDTNFDSLFTFGDVDSNMVPENTDSFDGAEFDFYLTNLTNPTTYRFDDRYGFVVELQYTGSGIYVWQIDENVIRQNTAAGYLPNDFVDRKGVDLEEADGVQDLDGGGFSGFIFGNHFDSFRAGDGNATRFGPATKPNTSSNSGVPSGIVIDNVSVIGSRMTFDLSRSIGYDEIRRRWVAAGDAQPPSIADIDDDGDVEIVVLADTGLVYVFNTDGSEYDDADADPSTIEPYIAAAGAIWAGPPALGDLDGQPDDEIVAAAMDGRLFAWKGTGAEVADGDNDPLTDGVLYAGDPMAAPPLLIDFNGDGQSDVAVVESANDSLRVGFVQPDGTAFVPTDPTFGPLWPLAVRGQSAAPLALARTGIGETVEQTGVVLAWIDTVDATAGVSYTPAMWSGGVSLVGEPPAQGWTSAWALRAGAANTRRILSAPAAGDIDADGNDEVVVTAADGRVLIYNDGVGANAPTSVALRAPTPSAPALGDVDLDGTLEIAVWDEEFMYLLKWNGALVSNWPQRIVPLSAGPQPPNEIERGLESPVIGDVDGDGGIEVLFLLGDGTLHGFEGDASVTAGFPRVGPADAKATPTVSALGSGGLSLLSVGFAEALGYFDTVVDTVDTTPSMTLSIQGLPGSSPSDRLFWPAYQAGSQRVGLVTGTVELKTASDAVRTETFMIYPNPVVGGEVHARVTLNASAEVLVEVYNLEGERAFERKYAANPGGLVDTPFDESIDVSRLKSGVYFLRLQITSSGGTEKLVKPFAVRR
jgi:M6 family metalloprotease-like protein